MAVLDDVGRIQPRRDTGAVSHIASGNPIATVDAPLEPQLWHYLSVTRTKVAPPVSTALSARIEYTGLAQSPGPGHQFFIELERYVLAGDFVSGVGYGILVVLWVSCIGRLWEKSQGSWATTVLLCYITLLLFVETAFSIVQARTVQLIYIENRNYPGGPWNYFVETQNQAINVLHYATIFAGVFLCDVLMLWRNWIIWTAGNPNRAAVYLVKLVPAITLNRIFRKEARAYGTAYYTLSLGLNVLLTVLITVRLLTYRRSLLKYLPAAHSNPYLSLCSVLVESAALHSAFAVAFLVSYAIKAPINALWLAVASAAQPIATFLIIYRVADGKAWTQRTVIAGGNDALYPLSESSPDRLANTAERTSSGGLANSRRLS
ncbi:hypothetical protein NUW54_g5086 [Trametes sanguinea]|uniref:Uncharacterized protein n=1 Tax=Trametes sanguinea TaxID=158606 RepID=A0ACC1PXN2_9APHY|nr:hypothetical protein NUW54_g5086 [Trametes sanguinea]